MNDFTPASTGALPHIPWNKGKLIGDQVHWQLLELAAEESQQLTFRVEVSGGDQITNDDYGVQFDDGFSIQGIVAVIT